MDYYLNPLSLSGAFPVPNSVVDNYFKFSKPEHIKVLLYVLRNMSSDPDNTQIANDCNLDEYEVKEALLYWADAGIILPKTAPVPVSSGEKENRQAVKRNEKPSRSDIAKMSLEDSKIQYLLGEAQKRLGRNLRDTEQRTLVWLYDEVELPVSVILLVLQYAISKDRPKISFVESLAVDLANKGIDNIADADRELHKLDMADKAWQTVSAIFGLERRKPSKKESETAVLWLVDWKISKEMLSLAYDECVNKKSKFVFSYVAKIVENWHNEGYTKPEDIKEKEKIKAEDFASYDIDLYEKMLNSKD